MLNWANFWKLYGCGKDVDVFYTDNRINSNIGQISMLQFFYPIELPPRTLSSTSSCIHTTSWPATGQNTGSTSGGRSTWPCSRLSNSPLTYASLLIFLSTLACVSSHTGCLSSASSTWPHSLSSLATSMRPAISSQGTRALHPRERGHMGRPCWMEHRLMARLRRVNKKLSLFWHLRA